MGDVVTTAGAISAYDPYIARAIRGIKSALAAGWPVMLRLHVGAEFPGDAAATLDLEGHAVVVVGYDDDRRALLLLDPALAAADGVHAAERWLSYEDFSLQVVDTSKGQDIVIAPLRIEVEPSDDETIIRFGFQQVTGPVIDADGIELRAERIRVGPDAATVDARAKLGHDGEIRIAAFGDVVLDLVLHGSRPLPYEVPLQLAAMAATSA